MDPKQEAKNGKDPENGLVTGGSQGIGGGLVKAFLDRGYNVVADSRSITKSGAFEASDKLALVALGWPAPSSG